MMRLLVMPALACALIGFSLPAAAEVGDLEQLVARKAAIIDLMHRKARKALVTAAQDRAYGDYFAHAHSPRERQTIKDRIDQISLHVQSRFHVEEMCLINPEGVEIPRIVGNRIAHDLSDQEASTIFFTPGFAQRPREVYVSPVYMSPDVDKWVVAYVTPVVSRSKKRAILHYEHDLTVYQMALNDDFDDIRPGDAFIVAIDEDGWVISDSRRQISLLKRGDSEERADYFEQFRLGELTLAEVRSAVGGSERAGAGRLSNDAGTFEVAYKTAGRWTILVARRA